MDISSMALSTRKEAAEKGLLKYNTGRACQRGHTSYRYTKTGTCSECTRWASLKYRQLTTARIAGLKRLVLDVHPDDIKPLSDMAEALKIARNLNISN
jgi:hypothetical protein